MNKLKYKHRNIYRIKSIYHHKYLSMEIIHYHQTSTNKDPVIHKHTDIQSKTKDKNHMKSIHSVIINHGYHYEHFY